VVLALAAITALIILLLAEKSRHTSSKATCRSNLKQIGLSVGMYMNDYETADNPFPPEGLPGVGWNLVTDKSGWRVITSTADRPDGSSVNLWQVLAHEGYLKIGWRDNRDRCADSVLTCPNDAVAMREVRDRTSHAACQYAHCEGGLTQSYAWNHVLVAGTHTDGQTPFPAPSRTMLAMDWNWWNAGSANQFSIRPELRSVHSP